jgi:hypothetical protein
MNMMECMECKGPPCPKGEIRSKVAYKQHVDARSFINNMLTQIVGIKVGTSASGAPYRLNQRELK